MSGSIRSRLMNIISEELGLDQLPPALESRVDSLIIHDLIGNEDSASFSFPKLWTEQMKKNWLNSQEHLRRRLRAKFGGKVQ